MGKVGTRRPWPNQLPTSSLSEQGWLLILALPGARQMQRSSGTETWPVSHPYTHTVDYGAGGHAAATVGCMLRA